MTTSGGRSSPGGSCDLALPAVPSTPRAARNFLADTLRHHQVMPGVVDVATLLTSELVTNAVRYGRGGVRLSIRTAPSVRVAVHDDNPEVPTLGPEGDDTAEGSRGLRLVDSLASRWGTDRHPGDGKDVWFEIDLRDG